VEPSYIIRKFLDVSHIEYLITYLEAIHEKKSDEKLTDKNHTSLLLNCYVK
jgi:vacuolar protein sorting-associated protein 11